MPNEAFRVVYRDRDRTIYSFVGAEKIAVAMAERRGGVVEHKVNGQWVRLDAT